MSFANKMVLVLSEKVQLANGKKEHKEVGRVQIPFPTLSDFGIKDAVAATYEKDDPTIGAVKGQPAFEDGVPLFNDPRYDWLQQAIAAKVAATVRNRFKEGKLKPGAVIPEDFEQLTAETQRTGEALALRRDAKISFEAYLQAQNKKAATVAVLGELFYNSAKVLQSAGANYIEALALHVGNWISSLKEEQKARFTPKILELQESINNAQGGNDLDDLK